MPDQKEEVKLQPKERIGSMNDINQLDTGPEEVDLKEDMRAVTDKDLPTHGQTPRYELDDEGNLIQIGGPPPGGEEEPREAAQKPQGETQEPEPASDAEEWQRLAYRNMEDAQRYRKYADVIERLERNPNDPEAIDKMMGVDKPSSERENDPDLQELEKFLEDDADDLKAMSRERTTRKEFTGPGKPPKEQSQPESKTGEASPEQVEEAQRRVNQVVETLSQEGYSQPAIIGFLDWLDSGRPELGDLFYAYASQRRREGKPLQRTRKSPVEEFGHPATGVTGESGRPRSDTLHEPATADVRYVPNANDLGGQ